MRCSPARGRAKVPYQCRKVLGNMTVTLGGAVARRQEAGPSFRRSRAVEGRLSTSAIVQRHAITLCGDCVTPTLGARNPRRVATAGRAEKSAPRVLRHDVGAFTLLYLTCSEQREV
jgi:hypothetical protein